MPKSTREYLDRVERYRAAWAPRQLGPDGAESMATMVVGETAQNKETARAL